MNKPSFLAVVLAASAALLSSCTGSAAHSANTAHEEHSDRKLAPDFALQDANGSSVKLSDYRGKVVLLNFWATWCGPCGLEIPWFEEFEQQYKAQGFEVVGVSMDEDGWKAIQPYVAAHKMNYRVLLGNDSVTQLYGGVDSLPTSFVLDRDGRIAFVHVGLAGKDDYLKEIQGLIGVTQTKNSRAGVGTVPAAFITRPAK